MTRASDTARLIGAGATILDGTTISTADNTNQLTLISTDADASTGPNLVLQRDSASPADNDLAGTVKFIADNDAGEATDCVSMFSKIIDASDGTEDASLLVNSIVGGSQVSRLNITPTEIAINEDGADLDFRVESDALTHALFVQAGSGGVGIGESSPNSYHANADDLVISGAGSGSVGITIAAQGGHQSTIAFADGTSGDTPIQGRILYNHNGDTLNFYTNGANERMRIDSAGAILINNDSRNNLGVVELLTTIGTDNAMIIKTAESGVSGTATAIKFRYNGSTVGTISYTGSSTSYATSSDYRLKENVTYDFDATTRLKQLKPCRFNFIGEKETVDGFLAHEVTSVPESIIGTKDETIDIGTIKDEDGNVLKTNAPEVQKEDGQTWTKTATENVYQGIDQSKLVPLLVKTVQELEARIATLESK